MSDPLYASIEDSDAFARTRARVPWARKPILTASNARYTVHCHSDSSTSPLTGGPESVRMMLSRTHRRWLD
jgi:hypothetical protein